MLNTTFNTQSSFQQRLEDIITKIKIGHNLSIAHPDYPTVSVPDNYYPYLQQMSESQRDRYLIHKLQRYLYDICMDRKVLYDSISDNGVKETESSVVNRGDRWYETEFYRQLVRSNHGQGYSDPEWSIVDRSQPYWLVTKEGLTLYIDPKYHLVESTANLNIGDIISIKLPANTVERGYYIAVGDGGKVSHRHSTPEQTILQLYFNTDSSTALQLLQFLTQQLNELKIPFDFRLPYREANFARADAAMLEFCDRDWQQLQPIVKHIYLSYGHGFKSEIPFFCCPITSGVGLAEKPFLEINESNNNLGKRCCHNLALTIVKAQQNEKLKEAERVRFIIENLSEQQTNLSVIHLNPSSKANYKAIF